MYGTYEELTHISFRLSTCTWGLTPRLAPETAWGNSSTFNSAVAVCISTGTKTVLLKWLLHTSGDTAPVATHISLWRTLCRLKTLTLGNRLLSLYHSVIWASLCVAIYSNPSGTVNGHPMCGVNSGVIDL